MSDRIRVPMRLLVAGLGVGLLVTTAACSEAKPQDDGGTPKVAFVIPNSQLNFATEMADGFRAGVRQVGGVDQVVEGPPIVDDQKQLEIFEKHTKGTKDGISVFTLSTDTFAEPLADAGKSGIPLIAVDNKPPSTANVKLFIGNDNYDLGQKLAKEIISKLPANATGKIVIGTSTAGIPVLDRRADGMRDEIRKRLPGVSVLGAFDVGQDVSASMSAWTALIKANPDALAFLGTGDAEGYQLAEIRRTTKASWLVGAFDIDPKALKSVQDGDLVLMSPEHYVKGALAGRLQAQHAKDGKPLPEGWLYTPGLLVTKANVDDIIARQATTATKDAYFKSQIDKILADKSALRPLSEAG